MNVAIDCRSLLLNKALQKFLKGSIVEESQADILITDYERESEIPVFLIGSDKKADLYKPFSRSQLMIRLEKKHKESLALLPIDDEPVEEEPDSLQKKIEALLTDYTRELIALIEEHHGKKA